MIYLYAITVVCIKHRQGRRVDKKSFIIYEEFMIHGSVSLVVTVATSGQNRLKPVLNGY